MNNIRIIIDLSNILHKKWKISCHMILLNVWNKVKDPNMSTGNCNLLIFELPKPHAGVKTMCSTNSAGKTWFHD